MDEIVCLNLNNLNYLYNKISNNISYYANYIINYITIELNRMDNEIELVYKKDDIIRNNMDRNLDIEREEEWELMGDIL